MTTIPTVVITGATSGLGQLVAIELAKRGTHLVLTARSKNRAEMTKKMLKDIMPNTEVDLFYVDLSLMEDVRHV
jgi:short-subunit dehydrogenase